MIEYQKALFVHIPKTGGSWVRSILKEHGGKQYSYPHDLPQNHKLHILWHRLKPFSFIRHPLCFVYSLWKHWSGDPQCRINNSDRNLHYQWDKRVYGPLYCDCIVEGDINLTVHNFTTKAQGLVSMQYDRFLKHCAYFGRHEEIQEDLLSILYSINGNVDSLLAEAIISKPAVNVSKGNDMPVDRTIATRFIENEPACLKYQYNYIPDIVSEI